MHAAYIRKYRVYQNSRPRKSISCQNNECRRGALTAGQGVQFYLQYLLSGRTHTGCQFQRPALRVLSLRELPPRGKARSLRSISPALSPVNKTKPDTEPGSVRHTHADRTGGGKQVGRCGLSGTQPAPRASSGDGSRRRSGTGFSGPGLPARPRGHVDDVGPQCPGHQESVPG